MTISIIMSPYPSPEQPTYMYGAICFPKAVKKLNGDNYVMHTDGTIYNCHPDVQGWYPIRFDCERSLPAAEYTRVLNLFKDLYCFHDQDGKPWSVLAFDMIDAMQAVCEECPQGTYTFDYVL